MDMDRAAVLIKKAALEYDKGANPILAPYDLTISQYKILLFLYGQPSRSAKVVDIERCYSMTHPTALGLLDNLEKKGFVTRIPNPEDGRSKLVSLTETADCLEPDLQELGDTLETEFTQTLSAGEREQLVRLLQKLLQRPEKENPYPVNRRRNPTMDPNNNIHRVALAEQAVESLNRYTHFHSNYQVSFTLAAPDEKGLPRIEAKFERFDGVPFAESTVPMDKKYLGLKDQTVAIRTFFFPMMKAEFDETEANQFDVVDFDYACIIGYNKDAEGNYVMKALYFPPTDALIAGHKPDEDGVWRSIRVPNYHMHKLSIDPRKTFSRHLYLAERFSEALEYQYDKYGFFFSNPEG